MIELLFLITNLRLTFSNRAGNERLTYKLTLLIVDTLLLLKDNRLTLFESKEK